MRIAFLLILLIISGCSSYTNVPDVPKLSSINIIDQNGFTETISSADRLSQYENVDFLKGQPYQKVLRVFSRDCNGDIQAYLTSYYPNSQTKQYLEIVNSRACGAYKEWYENGKLKVSCTVIGGEADIHTGAEKSWLFDGMSQAWDEEGHLLAEVPYQKGALEGCSTYYHANGKVWKEIPCHANQIEGKMLVYLPDGSLFQTAEYVNNVKHGPSLRYWENNQIASEENYHKGLLNTAKYYDRAGKEISQICNGAGFKVLFTKNGISEMQEFCNGIQEGLVKIYNENGGLSSTHHVKNDLKHGEEIEYYANGLDPKLSVNWAEGKIQGMVRTWYPNRMAESCREISNNKKNGLLTAWYRDGSLMLIEEYENDQLVKGEYYSKGERKPVSMITSGQGLAIIHDADGNLIQKISYIQGKPQT